MGMREFLLGAIVIGAAAGYVWSTPYSVIAERKVPASQRPPSAALAEVPPTIEDEKADNAWSSGEPLAAGASDDVAAKPKAEDTNSASPAKSENAD